MAGTGRVIGGHYLNASVAPGRGSELVVQTGFKGRKLTTDQVSEWAEVRSESKNNVVSAVGQAVAGVVLPRFISKAASAAVGASIDTTMRPARLVRIDWVDGKQSLLKLPDQLFTHLTLMLETRRAADDSALALLGSASLDTTPDPVAPPSVAEQALTHASDIVKGFLPSRAEQPPAPQLDVVEQLTKLAGLRDQGIISVDDFEAKKKDLLARL